MLTCCVSTDRYQRKRPDAETDQNFANPQLYLTRSRIKLVRLRVTRDLTEIKVISPDAGRFELNLVDIHLFPACYFTAVMQQQRSVTSQL